MRSLIGGSQPESYEQKYVAFLDILGFADHIASSESEPQSAQVLHKLMWSEGIAEEVGGENPETGDLTVFSDSLLMSHVDLARLLYSVSESWKEYAKFGFFLRGGIAYGNIIHQGRVAYGQAVIDAYWLESKVAKVPRVVIDPRISLAPEHHPGVGSKFILPNARRDSDGMVYLDTYVHFSTFEGDSSPQWLDAVKPHIERGLARHAGHPEILSKFRWLALRFNDAAEAARPLTSTRIAL